MDTIMRPKQTIYWSNFVTRRRRRNGEVQWRSWKQLFPADQI